MAGVSSSCSELNFEDINNVDKSEGGRNEQIDLVSLDIDPKLNSDYSLVSKELCPKVGISFETEEDAYEFYLAYAKKVGFRVRRSKSHRDKFGNFTDRLFCCSAEGKREKGKRDTYVRPARPETRFGCEARMKVSRQRDGKLHVVEFIEKHNHYLSGPNKTHLQRSHRKITSAAAIQIEMTNEVGIPRKASHDLTVRQVEGRENIGVIPEDYRNHLRTKRTRDVERGDTGGVLEYLYKMQLDDPNSFYAIQVDEDDLITNIFWSDAKMRAEYSNFGDVVCFDTTYQKNNEGRPLAIFVGVNHHKQMTLFGVALLYDETVLTFEWLFDTFAKAMFDRRPTTILTDEDAAMAKALALRWPETNHRLCIWHIYQNAAIHLSGVFSKCKDFSKDFSSCIYDFDEEEDFLNAWNDMLSKYTLEDNNWLRRMFGIKEKWALPYDRQMFCADITTTQRSESMNSVVKRYVSYKHTFSEFFNNLDRLLEDCRYEELKADLRMKISIPSLPFPIEILKHAVSVYTPEVFKCFENEWYKSHNSCIEACGEVGSVTKYEITPHKKSYHHIVTYDSSNGKVDCSCRKFEFAGILCSHVLKVFILKNIMEIPSQYILRRWMRKAKLGCFGVETSGVNKSNVDPKVCQSMWYKELCGLNIQLVTKAAEREETYKIVKHGIMKMVETVDARLQGNGSIVQQSNAGLQGIKIKKKTISGKRVKDGLEKKNVSGKRLKGDLEKASRRRSTETSQTPSNVTFLPPRVSSTIEASSSVDNLHTAQSHQPYCLPKEHFQVVSTGSSQHSSVEYAPFLMAMTKLTVATTTSWYWRFDDEQVTNRALISTAK